MYALLPIYVFFPLLRTNKEHRTTNNGVDSVQVRFVKLSPVRQAHSSSGPAYFKLVFLSLLSNHIFPFNNHGATTSVLIRHLPIQ